MSQSQISRTLRDEAAVARIASLLSCEQFDSRSALGRRVCEEFAFADARGRLQVAGCLKALTALAGRRPEIVPAGGEVTGGGPPPAPCWRTVSLRLKGFRRIRRAFRISRSSWSGARADRAVWNTLIAREHPHGMTTFAGCQAPLPRRLGARAGSARPGLPPRRCGARRGIAGSGGMTSNAGTICSGLCA